MTEVKSVTRKRGDQEKLQKQDVSVGDETKSCRLVLWESDVNSVEEGKSYRFHGVVVKKWGMVKYLGFTSESTKEEAEAVRNVNEEMIGDEEDEDDSGRSVKGEVTGVISATEYLSCKFCRAKVVPEDEVLAECSKCGAMMKVLHCGKNKAAKFVVTEDNGREVTLSVFEPVLSKIVDGVSGSSLARKLMMCQPKVYRYNDRNVVFSVVDM